MSLRQLGQKSGRTKMTRKERKEAARQRIHNLVDEWKNRIIGYVTNTSPTFEKGLLYIQDLTTNSVKKTPQMKHEFETCQGLVGQWFIEEYSGKLPTQKLTEQQTLNWRRVLVGMIGPYALIMNDEQIQHFRDVFQENANKMS